MSTPVQIAVGSAVLPNTNEVLLATLTAWSPLADVYVDPGAAGLLAIGTRYRVYAVEGGVSTRLAEGVYDDANGLPQRVIAGAPLVGTTFELRAFSRGSSTVSAITAAVVGWDPGFQGVPSSEQATSALVLTPAAQTLATLGWHPSVTAFVDGTTAKTPEGTRYTLFAVVAGMPRNIPVANGVLTSRTQAQPVIDSFAAGASSYLLSGFTPVGPPGGSITASLFGVNPQGAGAAGGTLTIEQNGVPLAGNPFAALNVTSPGGSVRNVGGVATQRYTTPYAVVYRQGAVSTDSVFGTWAEIKALLAICEVPLTIICDGVNVGGVCTVPASTGQTDMKGTTVLSAYGSGFALGQALFIEDGASLLNLWGTDWALFVFGTPTIITPIVYTLDVVPWLDHGASWDLGAGSTLPFCEIPAVAPFIPPDDGISFDIFNGAGFESDEPTLGCVQVDRAPGEGAQAGVTVFAVNHTFLLNSIGGAFGGAGFLAIASDSNQRDYIALPLPPSPRNGAPGAIAYPNFTGSFSSASYAFATYTQYNDSLQAPTLNQDYVQGVIDQLKAAIFGGATATSTGRIATRTTAVSTVLNAGSDGRVVIAGAGAPVVIDFPNTSTVPAGTTFQTCVLDAASAAAGVTAISLGGATFQDPTNPTNYVASPNLAFGGAGTVLDYTLDVASGNWNLA